MHQNQLPPARILIIDDEPSNIRLLERVLELYGGVEWRSTTDSREAIPLFAEFSPDLVLTDLHMPHVDGYQVMAQIRELLDANSFLPIVVLTADISPETRRKALRFGASDFITKPLDTTEVQLRIRNLLENRFLNLRLDETVRKRTEELEKANLQLIATQQQVVRQERLRALGVMASGIAHDFNNALTMILGYGELLLPWFQGNSANSKERTFLTHIIAAAQDATHVVARLREFYRPAEDDEVRVPLDPNQLCEQAVAFTAPKWKVRARALGATIRVETDFQSANRVVGSGPELREVLTNLIFNACDAMPEGGEIVMRTLDCDGTVKIDISDTGIGMTSEQIEMCLEPFYSTKGERGTGLGLSVAYGIIQRHGGRIEIRSTVGAGSTFSLILPATSAPTSVDDVEQERNEVRPVRVLIVDDQEIICELISEQLRADGNEPSTVYDGYQALEALKNGEFDVLITDQSMPGMNGEQLAAECKRLYPDMPVILLTGFGEEMKAVGTLPEGISMIVPKPVSGADLRKALYEVCGRTG